MNPSIPLPKDPRHQRFADLVLGGMSAAESHRKAGFKGKTAGSRATMGSRMLRNVDIRAYMEAVRATAGADDAAAAVLTLVEKRKFLARIVRVPLARINPEDADDPNADLVESYRRSDSETGSTVAFKKLSPLSAIEADNKLCGDGQPDAGAVLDLVKAIATLAGPVLPADRM
ncbi:MAG: hypothetical protein WCK77_14185 [Verrucomicrobiota bacterium]